MSDRKNDDIKKIIEQIKEQSKAEADTNAEPQIAAPSVIHTDEEIREMLRKHFSSNGSSSASSVSKEHYFDTVDFGVVDDEVMTGEIQSSSTGDIPATLEEIEEDVAEIEEKIEESVFDEEEDEEIEDEVEEEVIEEAVEDNGDGIVDEIVDEVVSEDVDEDTVDEVVEEIAFVEPEIVQEEIRIEEIQEETQEETQEEIQEEIQEDDVPWYDGEESFVEEFAQTGALPRIDDELHTPITPSEAEEVVEESAIEDEIVEETIEESIVEEELVEEATEEPTVEEEIVEERIIDEPLAEEPIDYSDVLEGQQGTVFNNFVEDFSGDLDDVVFEAEITESRAPDKQYTIFEDWQRLMKNKDYTTAEADIIPPTKEELDNSREIARRASANTDYFSPVTAAGDELDAVDIALMVALGGEKELNQTVGFEKIRQAVHDSSEQEDDLKGKSIYGFCGDEYRSVTQNTEINKKYKKDKTLIIVKAVATFIFALLLAAYEVGSWIGLELPWLFNASEHPDTHILAAMQVLFFCAALSYDKLIKLFKNFLGFSSVAYIGGMILLFLNVGHDILLLLLGYAEPSMTFHSLSALLFCISMVYDLFEVFEQHGVFRIASSEDKKLVLEPYGKLRMGEGEDMDSGEIIDKDSYCISRVSLLKRFFARVSQNTPGTISKVISLIVSLSTSLCVMLALLLMKEAFSTIMLGFILTLSFSLIISAIFESEFAFFIAYKVLGKQKTGIIGKASVAEYGKANIVYFDDYNVFNKKSVRTKGLKLYDNNEIYRVLYHTQAVFSKIGGPLKSVFEFATSEMVHSKSVEIKEISKEGVVAIVDGRTSVLIGTGAFMRSCGIHPKYTSADLKLEDEGEDSIMFIALNGTLGAKLYVTYKFSSEFEKLARRLAQRGVGIGIRSSDPNINTKWSKKYGAKKNFRISSVRPTIKELGQKEKSIEGGVLSTRSVRALTEALMMCIKLDSLEGIMSKLRIIAVIFVGILTFALVLFSGINTVSMLALALALALCTSIMVLLTHFYLKH